MNRAGKPTYTCAACGTQLHGPVIAAVIDEEGLIVIYCLACEPDE